MNFINQVILYFFTPNPGRTFGYYILVEAIIIILLGLALAVFLYSRKHKDDKAFKKLFRNFPTKFIIIAVLLGLYLLCRYYLVAFFSMRFMLYILIGATIYVVYSATYTYFKKYPIEKKQREERIEHNKYIPRKKKKKKR